jgi:hypothetical protein
MPTPLPNYYFKISILLFKTLVFPFQTNNHLIPATKEKLKKKLKVSKLELG